MCVNDCFSMDTKRSRPVTFAAWLDSQLRRREWSATTFAKKIGKPQGTVSRWLTGARIPDPDSCDRIADVLFVDPDEVLVIAGHRPRLPMDQLEKFHSLADPYARKLDWDDPENRLSIENALQHLIRVQELRRGTRAGDQALDPVELEDEEE